MNRSKAGQWKILIVFPFCMHHNYFHSHSIHSHLIQMLESIITDRNLDIVDHFPTFISWQFRPLCVRILSCLSIFFSFALYRLFVIYFTVFARDCLACLWIFCICWAIKFKIPASTHTHTNTCGLLKCLLLCLHFCSKLPKANYSKVISRESEINVHPNRLRFVLYRMSHSSRCYGKAANTD